MTFIANPTGAYFERSLGQMGNLRQSIETLQTKIATGQRIQRGSEDPVAASRLRMLARIEVQGETDGRNAQRVEQELAQASSEIDGVTALFQRVRELAVVAANDPVGEKGRAAIALEIEQMGEELFARANALSLTGEPLFGGTAPGPAFTRDAGGAVTYQGNGESGAVSVAPATEVERGVPGSQVFEFDLDGSPSSAFDVIAGLAAALKAGAVDPAAAAKDALKGIDTALDTVSRSQTVIGTRLAWIEAIQLDQQTRAVDVAEKRSQIGDTDVADTIVRLQQTMVALEATQAGFARVGQLSLFDRV